MISWQQLRLRIEIALWRYGWLWAVMIALTLASLGIFAWWLPHQTSVLSAQQSRIALLKRAQDRNRLVPATDVGVSNDELSAQQLAKILYSPAEVSTALQLVQQIAKAKNVTLTQSEFQTSSEGHGGLRQVQVTLPIRCSYLQLRDFSNTLLRQLPGISLDQVILKRDNIAQSQADVRLKISIWVDPQKLTAAPKNAPQKNTAPVGARATP